MSQYPTSLVESVAPIPDSVDQTTLNRHGLHVMQGLTIPLARQLVELSKDPLIVEFCPNDSKKRFASIDAIEAWQQKGRLALPLVRGLGERGLTLAGFGWMGPQPPGENEPNIPSAKTTFAIRIYEDARGQGNALPYTRAILRAHHGLLFGSNGVWLEAWADNLAAIKTYERAGFRQVANLEGSRHGQPRRRVYDAGWRVDRSV